MEKKIPNLQKKQSTLFKTNSSQFSTKFPQICTKIVEHILGLIKLLIFLKDMIYGTLNEKEKRQRTMDEDWKNLAEKYDDKDWSFSSAKAWEEVVKENPKPFNKIQYVDQLRLSGNYSKGKEIIERSE